MVFQPVEEPGLHSGADWVSNIYERKNSKAKQGQQVPPFPCGQLFQVHGNKLKLHPVRHLSQASVLCITHRVFFLGVREDPLNGFLSALVELRVRRRISGIVRQFLIVLPDMPHRFDTAPGMRTPFSGRTGRADIRIALVFPISIPVRGAVFQGLVFGTYHAVVEFIIDILPPLVSILHGLRALVGCGKDSAIAEHFPADMRRFVCSIGYNGLYLWKIFRYFVVNFIKGHAVMDIAGCRLFPARNRSCRRRYAPPGELPLMLSLFTNKPQSGS